MFCIQCGRPCSASDAFCGSCGQAICETPRPSQAGTSSTPRSSSLARAATWGVALLLVFGLVLANLYRGPDPTAKTLSDPGNSIQSKSSQSLNLTRLSPAVLTLYVFGAKGEAIGQGSGFVIRNDGVAITNWHVAKDAHTISAVNGTGQTFKVESLINVDDENDLVTMQLEKTNAADTFHSLSIADSRSVVPGQKVYTLSAPQGLSQSITDGILSAFRAVDGLQLLQITAPISPGSSGGPVLNDRGEVIGVIKGLLTSGQQLNFAIPVDAALRLINMAPMTSLPTERSRTSNDRAVESSPDSLFEQGLKAYEEKHYVESAKLFERVMTQDSANLAALYNAALAHVNGSDYARGIEYFRRFIRLASADDEGLPVAKSLVAKYAAELAKESALTSNTERTATVWLTKKDSDYHLASCPLVKSSGGFSVSRSGLGVSQRPCPLCRPDELSRHNH